MAQPTTNADRRRRDRVEVVATVLLALAAVATAWCSYQANRWNGEQAKAASRTNALRIDAARTAAFANAEKQVDIGLFVQWVDAAATQEAFLQQFYVERFRPEFKRAFDAWIATDPFDNPSAPLSPFAMPEYDVEASEETGRLDRAADASAASVQRNIQRSSNYVLGVVLFAIALFFGGMSTRLESPTLRVALVTVGGAVFVGTAVWVATSPVTIAV